MYNNREPFARLSSKRLTTVVALLATSSNPQENGQTQDEGKDVDYIRARPSRYEKPEFHPRTSLGIISTLEFHCAPFGKMRGKNAIPAAFAKGNRRRANEASPDAVHGQLIKSDGHRVRGGKRPFFPPRFFLLPFSPGDRLSPSLFYLGGAQFQLAFFRVL